MEQCRLLILRQAVRGCCLALHAANARIVDAADIGEKMVFDLIIEPADVPGEKMVAGGEVGSGHHSVDEPGLFHGALGIWQGVVRAFHDVGELEDQAEDEPRSQVHGEVIDEELPGFAQFWKQVATYFTSCRAWTCVFSFQFARVSSGEEPKSNDNETYQ